MTEWEKKMEIAKNIDLVDLVSHLGYTVKPLGSYFTVTEMDSIRIRNRKSWCRYSSPDDQRGDCIAWMQKIEGKDFKDAVNYLADFGGYRGDITVEPVHRTKKQTDPPKPAFVQPSAALYQSRLYEYLCDERGISQPTVKKFLNSGLIYVSNKYQNIVFVGRDSHGIVKHAAVRSTNQDHPFKGDVMGSDKRYAFNVTHQTADTLVVAEAPIDIISYYDITKDKTSNLLACAGTSDNALVHYLAEHPDIKHLKLIMDADWAGDKATIRLMEKYQSEEWAGRLESVEDIRYPWTLQIGCKDVNDILQYRNDHPGEIPVPFSSGNHHYNMVKMEDKKVRMELEKQLAAEKRKADLLEKKIAALVPAPQPSDTVTIQDPLEEFKGILQKKFNAAFKGMDNLPDELDKLEQSGYAHALFDLCIQLGFDPTGPQPERKSPDRARKIS